MASDSLADPFTPSAPSPAPSSSLLDVSPPAPRASHKPSLTTLLTTTDLSAATGTDLELPEPPPLSHDVLSGDDFDASDFLLERRHTSLEDLRSDLRAYLATLRTSLVGVINEEYEAFIGLSLGLKHANVSHSLQTIRRPVLSTRGEVTHVKSELEDMRDEMSGVLDERKEVREMKSLMRRLLATEEAVEKVEGLLKVGKGGEKARQLDLSVDSPAKRLERIASEYTHMRYLVERAGDLPFVHSLQPRITLLTSTLHSELSTLLTSILSSSPSSSSYRPELTIALRTFSSLSFIPLAESLVREAVVEPFLQREVHRDALSSSTFPETGHKDYVPEAYRLEPIDPPKASREGDATPLAALYNRILRFVEDECSVLLDVAERVVGASSLPAAAPSATKDAKFSTSTSDNSSTLPEVEGFDLLTPSLIAPLLDALTTHLGSTIFAAGRPNVFHTHYLLTLSFLSRLEALTSSLPHLHSFRSSPAYLALFKRFQLPVYFQLRLKDAVSSVERAFDVGQASGGGGDGFVMSESEAVWKSVRRCWDEGVWLEELGGRFWRLMLQILSRYRTWLNDQVPRYVLPSSSSTAALSSLSTSASASSTRPSTPGPPSGQGQGGEEEEERTLRQLTVLIADAGAMERRVWGLWEERVRGMVEPGDEGAGDVLRASLDALTSLTPSLSSQLATILVKRCAEHLKLVRSVASQVRASTRRQGQEREASYFVGNILKELRSFLGGPGRVVEESVRVRWAETVVEEVAARYAAILSTQKKTEDSLRWLKKGRQGLSFFSRGSSASNDQQQPGESDDDRVKMQMQLDVETLAKDAEGLGVEVGRMEAFERLRRATRGEEQEGK
ncbi:hypothetical protein JCM8547_004805 [Rhodosporidiobolus lusitaniae]